MGAAVAILEAASVAQANARGGLRKSVEEGASPNAPLYSTDAMRLG
jgi:hypothetical protein